MTGGKASTRISRTSSARIASAALCLVPFVLALLVLLRTPQPTITPDSDGYLRWAADRTSPYPAFIWAVGVRQIVPVQLFLLAGSLGFLAYLMQRCLGSLLLSGAVVVGVAANPELWELQTSVLSEALTTPLILLFLAACVVFVTERRSVALVLAALAAGIAAATRPSLVPLIAVAPVAAYLLRLNKRHAVAVMCAAMSVFCIAVDRLAAHAVYGPNTTSLLGRHLFAKSALIDIGAAAVSFEKPLEVRFATLAQVDYAPVRQTVAEAPPAVRRYLREAYEVCFQYACTDQSVAAGQSPAERSRAQFNVGLGRSLRNPWSIIALAADEYRSMWVFHPQTRVADALRSLKAERGPLPFERQLLQSGLEENRPQETFFERIFQLALILTGWACAVALAFFAAFLWRGDRRPATTLGLLSSLAVQLILIFDSFAGVGVPRYVMGIWPLIVLSVVCLLLCATPLFLAERPFRKRRQ